MKRNLLNIILSIIIGGFFLWLSLRNIEFDELVAYVNQMSYGWIAPFFLVAVLSFWLRCERWKLLVENDHPGIRRSSLFGGVVFGYLVNYAVPRLGELTRSVFVSKRDQVSSSNMLGTVVLERIIDLLTILVLIIMVMFFVISDRQTLDSLFGPQAVNLLDELRNPWVFSALIIVGILSLVLFWRACVYIFEKRKRESDAGKEPQGIFRIIYLFTDGLVSIRKLKRWPMFLIYTILLWVCYVLLTWIPFFAFDMAAQFSLSPFDALAVMTIATLGVMLPSPGAFGTYHWFVKQSLLVLYAVPAVTGLAFAFVSHAAMLFAVLVTSLVFWVYLISPFSGRADE